MVTCLGQGADLQMAQLMPLPFTISCSTKSRLVLPFWCQLTRVVPHKIQQDCKTVVCVCVCVPVDSIESFVAVWKIAIEWSFLCMRTVMKLQCIGCEKCFGTIYTYIVILTFIKTEQQKTESDKTKHTLCYYHY